MGSAGLELIPCHEQHASILGSLRVETLGPVIDLLESKSIRRIDVVFLSEMLSQVGSTDGTRRIWNQVIKLNSLKKIVPVSREEFGTIGFRCVLVCDFSDGSQIYEALELCLVIQFEERMLGTNLVFLKQ